QRDKSSPGTILMIEETIVIQRPRRLDVRRDRKTKGISLLPAQGLHAGKDDSQFSQAKKERPMTRHFSIARLSLALLAVLALAGPAAAERQGKQVPFRGSLEGLATATPRAPPFVAVNVEGSGNATQLGRFDVSNS